jgi:hypothetical protein
VVVRFAQGHEYSHSESAPLPPFQPAFPLLARYVRGLQLWKVDCYSTWTCTDTSAAHVGLRPDYVADLIKGKSAPGKHAWAENSEKWLLVYASGSPIVASAGSPPSPADWHNPELQAACRDSPFDQIHFWDLPHRWSERWKPRQ